jgi:hypothetical protein
MVKFLKRVWNFIIKAIEIGYKFCGFIYYLHYIIKLLPF